MKLANATDHLIECFNRGVFPDPHEFADRQIDAIAGIPGIDTNGTFANSPLEQSLIRRYGLEAKYGEHSWPGFAQMLRETKSAHYSFPARLKDLALNELAEAIATCLSLGITREQICEQSTVD